MSTQMEHLTPPLFITINIIPNMSQNYTQHDQQSLVYFNLRLVDYSVQFPSKFIRKDPKLLSQTQPIVNTPLL